MSWRYTVVALVFASVQLARADDAAASDEQALFEKLPVVEAAALHQQTLEEAPANVTVISSADIRKYGYRTLGEALNSVRGFYLTNDRIYNYVGVRGFALPGDYNTRFLVMIDGHPMTEHVYGSNNFFGQDFGLDMDLVERIEIIRGPTSALYGSSGMLANINIVTRSPVDFDLFRASTETGGFGEKKAMVSSSSYLGRGANLLASASVFNNAGQDYFFREFNSPSTNNGWARGVDGERGYHTFANLIWHDWSILASFSSREKQPPVAWDSDALFDDPGDFVQDRRGFAGVSFKHVFPSSSELRWQFFYDQYDYDERFDYAGAGSGIEDLRNTARNDWLDSELTYRFSTGHVGALTVGVEGSIDLRNELWNYIRAPQERTLLLVNAPNREGAIFAQEEWTLSSRWTASLGIRFDASRYFENDVSPRLALVYQPSQRTVWKFVYGRAFRNPSMYEQFFQDGLALVAASKLRPETGHTVEVSFQRKLGANWSTTAATYYYLLNDLIAVYTPNGLPPGQYQNGTGPHALGAEAELSGTLFKRIDVSASVAFQNNTSNHDTLPDAPRQVHKGRIGAPVFGGKLFLSGAVSYVSNRETVAGASTGSALVTDFTLTTAHLTRDFDLQTGIRNAFNDRYYDPVGLAIDQMIQDGRSAYVKLIWHSKE